MSNDKWPDRRYVPSTFKRECDRCGFDYLRNELRKEWTGAIVCQKCEDPKERIVRARRERRIKID